MGLRPPRQDWRYVVRINIDQEDLTKNAASGPTSSTCSHQAVELVPNINAGRPSSLQSHGSRPPARIMNKTVNSSLSIEQITRANGALVRVPMFDGIPVSPPTTPS